MVPFCWRTTIENLACRSTTKLSTMFQPLSRCSYEDRLACENITPYFQRSHSLDAATNTQRTIVENEAQDPQYRLTLPALLSSAVDITTGQSYDLDEPKRCPLSPSLHQYPTTPYESGFQIICDKVIRIFLECLYARKTNSISPPATWADLAHWERHIAIAV